MENLSQKDVLKQTGLKFYQLEHLIKSGVIPVYQFGKGNPRKFRPEVIDIIKARLDKLNTGE